MDKQQLEQCLNSILNTLCNCDSMIQNIENLIHNDHCRELIEKRGSIFFSYAINSIYINIAMSIVRLLDPYEYQERGNKNKNLTMETLIKEIIKSDESIPVEKKKEIEKKLKKLKRSNYKLKILRNKKLAHNDISFKQNFIIPLSDLKKAKEELSELYNAIIPYIPEDLDSLKRSTTYLTKVRQDYGHTARAVLISLSKLELQSNFIQRLPKEIIQQYLPEAHELQGVGYFQSQALKLVDQKPQD